MSSSVVDTSAVLVVTLVACWDEPHVIPCQEDASHTNHAAREWSQQPPPPWQSLFTHGTGTLVYSHPHSSLNACSCIFTWHSYVWCHTTHLCFGAKLSHFMPDQVLTIFGAQSQAPDSYREFSISLQPSV